MLSPEFFIETLKANSIDFFAGVPDSLLKNVCAYIADNVDSNHNIIAANEGAAVGLVAGYHLATGKVGVVYMQNSGQGNTINPLASLTDKEVYKIPLLMLIGWRGRPGVHDEPQHIKQGKITTGLLNVLGINYEILAKEEEQAGKQIAKAVAAIHSTGEAYALIVEKDTFETYKLQQAEANNYPLSRERAIQIVAASMEDTDVVVSTTGMISRELFEYRTAQGQSHEKDFLTVGSMGHASQIALGIDLAGSGRRVWCLDGDGATLMHMGSLAVVADKASERYIHVVFNNGAHDSVGGQPTLGLKIDMQAVAKAVGYKHVASVASEAELRSALDSMKNLKGPQFIEIKVHKGNRSDLGRPTTSPQQNKEALMAYIANSISKENQ